MKETYIMHIRRFTLSLLEELKLLRLVLLPINGGRSNERQEFTIECGFFIDNLTSVRLRHLQDLVFERRFNSIFWRRKSLSTHFLS